MRNPFYTSATALLVCVLFSFQGKAPDYSKVLPGVVKVHEGLYYDQTEITNLDWQEYALDIARQHGKDSPQYRNVLPDSTVWSGLEYGEPYRTYYYSHPAYSSYPVVGITWKQATEYCLWRTNEVKASLQEDGKLDKAPAYFNYRLPTYEEWKMMYADLKDMPNFIGAEGKKKYRGMARWNMKRAAGEQMAQAGKLNDNADITAPVRSYWPNGYGVYNIKGNISEWLLEQNTHVGGAWNVPMASDVGKKQRLDSVSASVGFRCVCEVATDVP